MFERILEGDLEKFVAKLNELDAKKGYTFIWETYRTNIYQDREGRPQVEHSVVVYHNNIPQPQAETNSHMGFGRKE